MIGSRRVAVLGLGSMGSRMAGRIAESGGDVVVWNRSAPSADEFLATYPNAGVARDPASAADGADVVIAMLSDDDASRSVWIDAGVLDALGGQAVAVEASTVRPAWARRLAAETDRRGRSIVEAPVVGSRPQADAGALVTLAGGDDSTIASVRPVLECYSSVVRHVGGVGAAATLKLAVNGLFGIQVAAYAEVVGMLERSAVDTALAVELLSGLPITSPGLQRILALIAERDFRPNFPVPLVAKDFGYLVDAAGDLDAAVPLAAAAADIYSAGADGEQAELDIAGIASRYL